VTPPLRQRRLIFVTGKGGVGKTTVATALALSLSRAGKKVLLCSIDERPDIAEAFGRKELTFAPVEVEPGMFVMGMETEAALREYLKINLKLPFLGKLGPVATALDFVATAAPGVKEILTIGKICFEVRERHYDVVVVDAPATGHVVGYLSAPRAINDMAKVGLIRSQTSWMEEILGDAEATSALIVTTAEEMPVQETLELMVSLRNKTQVHLDAVLVNRVIEVEPSETENELIDERMTGESPVAIAWHLARARSAKQGRHLSHLETGVSAPVEILRVPEIVSQRASELVEAVAASLGAELT
jgi:anion-transporting  ArsA/GET3 family ATPase